MTSRHKRLSLTWSSLTDARSTGVLVSNVDTRGTDDRLYTLRLCWQLSLVEDWQALLLPGSLEF